MQERSSGGRTEPGSRWEVSGKGIVYSTVEDIEDGSMDDRQPLGRDFLSGVQARKGLQQCLDSFFAVMAE